VELVGYVEPAEHDFAGVVDYYEFAGVDGSEPGVGYVEPAEQHGKFAGFYEPAARLPDDMYLVMFDLDELQADN